MLVTIEKYDIVKGVTYKRQFELNTDCVIFENDGLTIAITHGNYSELKILCRDKENVDFITATLFENISNDFVCYHFDTIKYFYDNDIKILVKSNDTF